MHAVTQLQPVEKVCFIKIEQILYPYPQTPFPWKGAILLGLPPLVPVGGYAPQPNLPPLVPVGGYAPQPHFNKLKPLHGVSHQLVAVKDDRERSVVQKLYLHIRTEPSCLHVGYAFTLPALLNDILVQFVCHIG